MVNPDDITNFNRTDRELQEFMVFAICAAGKNANTTATILNEIFVHAEYDRLMPIQYLFHRTPEYLRDKGIGCWRNRYKTIRQLYYRILPDVTFLRTATLEELEAIHGIGPKTSRFFLMHSRRNQRVAALDTHILKELKEAGYDVPKSTPAAGKKYRELEKLFIQMADDAGRHVADFDLEVWKKWRKKPFDILAGK